MYVFSLEKTDELLNNLKINLENGDEDDAAPSWVFLTCYRLGEVFSLVESSFFFLAGAFMHIKLSCKLNSTVIFFNTPSIPNLSIPNDKQAIRASIIRGCKQIEC